MSLEIVMSICNEYHGLECSVMGIMVLKLIGGLITHSCHGLNCSHIYSLDTSAAACFYSTAEEILLRILVFPNSNNPGHVVN